ncbi:MAG: nuclear transport factor 2 family protein [Myxococcota bacterium]
MDGKASPSPVARNQALVDRYFELLQKGDPGIGELFTPDARWLAPQSAPVGRLHEGRDAVLRLMGSGLGLYDLSRPMEIERTASLAGDPLVYIEMTIRATTKAGEPYENHYVMVFQLRDGRIAEVREYVDSLYAQCLLFDPAGQPSPLVRASN